MFRRLLSAADRAWHYLAEVDVIATLEGRLLSLLVERAHRRGQDIRWMRRYDALTGLLNRLAFEECVRDLRRRNISGSVAVLDLDCYKVVNDHHGHAAGDAVLCAIATRLRATITADIVAARFGGDEFVLFIPGDMSRALPLLNRLRISIREPMDISGATITVTASIGVAPLPLSIGLSVGITSADLAMYAAKSSGRDQVLEFSTETQGVVTARRELAKTVVLLQERNRELQNQVQMDALTGLRSRRALDEVLELCCGGVELGREHCAVAFLDIDHFGSYNKHHGDDRGDVALREVAQIIQGSARRSDLVFRKGGEEIVVVLPGATQEEAMQAGERMRSAVEAARIQHGNSPTAAVVTVTVGVASSYGRELTTVHQLMNLAAQAAMRAKVEARRNEVHVA